MPDGAHVQIFARHPLQDMTCNLGVRLIDIWTTWRSWISSMDYGAQRIVYFLPHVPNNCDIHKLLTRSMASAMPKANDIWRVQISFKIHVPNIADIQ
jgi:hypothetical protein